MPHFFVLKAPPPPKGFPPGGQADGGGVGHRTAGPASISPEHSSLHTPWLLSLPATTREARPHLSDIKETQGTGGVSWVGRGTQTHPPWVKSRDPPPPAGTPPESRLPRHGSLTFSQPTRHSTRSPPPPPCPPSALFMFQSSDLHRPRPQAEVLPIGAPPQPLRHGEGHTSRARTRSGGP